MSKLPRVVAIIPARMDSHRLPGKALLEVNGRPLIDYVLARAAQIPGVAVTVVATTTRDVDDVLVEYAKSRMVQFFRGESDDVAKRVLGCAVAYDAEYFIRVNGDSVLTDYELIGEGVSLCASRKPDFVTNIPGRTFPYGIAVEIIKTSTFAEMYPKMQSEEEREHITQYVYNHPGGLNIAKMTSLCPHLSSARLVVDTEEDFKKFKKIVDILGKDIDTADYRAVASVCLKHERNMS